MIIVYINMKIARKNLENLGFLQLYNVYIEVKASEPKGYCVHSMWSIQYIFETALQ